VLQDILCRSANFRNTITSGGQGNCELLKTVDLEEPAENLKKDENFDYYKLLQPERVRTVRKNWTKFQTILQNKINLINV
jgi:hypothetical protein